ncbi:MAG: GGDEF domain-containing protein [Chromatiales bacterium]|nr:GGDEF domain-containing protein [Chromatiales bacterium]
MQSRHALKILGTEPEERFDRFTRLACKIFDVPIALVSLIDRERQWFKSRYGINVEATPREVSFCGHVMNSDEVLVVHDVCADDRFNKNAMIEAAPNIRFYAGYPLRSPDGDHLGTFCLIDKRPREFASKHISMLLELAQMVEAELLSATLATTDELTGISNRRGFNAIAGHALTMCRDMSKPATLVMFDLDDFKAINDNLGHEAGDRVLAEFARALLKTFRESDVVARIGGDEFAVLVTGSAGSDVHLVLARLNERLARRNRGFRDQYALQFSAGVVTFEPERHQDLDVLLHDADKNMYARKRDRSDEAIVPG